MITSANNSANITPNKKTKNANNMTSKTEATNTNAKAETTTGTTTTPPDMITPSYVAKSKWNEVVDQLPNETLQAITRTYTNRLHQLRLQREKHQGTHERHTQPGATLPASCLIKFELGASAAIRERPAYQELKTKVERSIEETQSLFKKSIVQLQVLEMQVKEEEIQKMFCEGLCKIAMALINHHRDTNPNLRIAKTMQSMRLADRLVELLMEQHGHILEFSYLVQEGPPSNRLPQYYGHVGRDQPTHSAKQNRNNRSSPYNPHHTRILEGLLPEFKDIVEPCFHSSWKEYLEARSKLHQKQTQAKAAAAAAAKAKAAEPPKKDKQQYDSAKRDEAKLPSAQALKEMVHNAVTEETQALTDKIRHLEEQLQQKEAGAATPATAPATATATTTDAEGGAKKGRNRRNKKNSENGKEEEGAAEPNKEEAKPTPNGNQKEDEAKAEEEASPEATAETGAKGNNRRRNRGKNNNDNANNTEGEKKVEPANANRTIEAKKDDEAKTETPAPAAKSEGEAAKEEPTNGANDGAATGNKKKRNRKRNKGKGANATNEDTPTNGATALDKQGEATNGAKPENGNTNGAKKEEPNNGNANGAKKEEPKNGNATGAKKEETKNDNDGAKKDESKPAAESNGNTNGVDTQKPNGNKRKNKKKNNNPQAASMHDSTTEMFGSYHSTGDKNWD